MRKAAHRSQTTAPWPDRNSGGVWRRVRGDAKVTRHEQASAAMSEDSPRLGQQSLNIHYSRLMFDQSSESHESPSRQGESDGPIRGGLLTLSGLHQLDARAHPSVRFLPGSPPANQGWTSRDTVCKLASEDSKCLDKLI
jgi:hypothetical protein